MIAKQATVTTVDATAATRPVIRMNRTQILQLLALVDDDSSTVVVQFGAAGHSGAGLYAWDEEYAHEGASFLDPEIPADRTAIDVLMARVVGATPMPPDLHPRTADLVRRFSVALAVKLAHAEHQYGYADAWSAPDWMGECREKMLHQIAKGDPLDAAAYSAFLWHHRMSTAEVSE